MEIKPYGSGSIVSLQFETDEASFFKEKDGPFIVEVTRETATELLAKLRLILSRINT